MRPFLILWFSLTVLVQIFGQNLYDDENVIKMELIFEEANYWELLTQNKETKIDIPATVIVNEIETFDSVGVRFKGNSSYYMSNDKKPFNISMDEFIEDQNLWGYETFNLNNAFMDPTFMREKITYDIFRKYIPAGQVGYVDLYINGMRWGLYVNVEQVNKDFIRQWFSSDEGNLYKGDPRGTMQWLGENADDYLQQFEKKTNEDKNDWSDMIHFLDILHHSQNLQEELPEVLNVDRVLWYMALCNILVNLDSYIYEGHNYYFYHDPASDQFNIIPWDLNESFGCFPSGRLMIQEREQFPLFYGEVLFNLPLSQILFSVPEYRSIYMAHYESLFKHEFQVDTLNSIIDNLKTLIEPYVQDDPKKLYSYDLFLKNITTNVRIQDNRDAPGLLKLITNRVNYLSNYSDFVSSNITISDLMFSEVNPNASAVFTVTANISSENPIEEVLLFYKIDKHTFIPISMVNTDLNKTSAVNYQYSGDIIIPDYTAGYKLQFYIRAMNDASQMFFYPEKAEFEVFELDITSDAELNTLVINEFMADNDNSLQDPQGEYNDWIEFYNPTESDIELNDYALTDDLNEPMKWVFPDTIISADGYLIIWADDDENDSGLHASFKLDKSGETIALYNPENQLVDAITYSSQTTDQSYGRIPNGSGEFMSLENSSPGEANANVTSIDGQISNIPDFGLLNNFPNPFNSETTIQYALNENQKIRVYIVNSKGQRIKELLNTSKQAGEYTLNWDGRDDYYIPAATGIYFVVLETSTSKKCRKIIFLK